MDIAALSMVFSQSKVQQQASMSVMKMAMDTAEQNAVNMANMLSDTKAMEQAVQPYLGTKLDIQG